MHNKFSALETLSLNHLAAMFFIPFGRDGGDEASLPENWGRRHKKLRERYLTLTISNHFENIMHIHHIILRIICSIALSSKYTESLFLNR
jgi:hypothetical protein